MSKLFPFKLEDPNVLSHLKNYRFTGATILKREGRTYVLGKWKVDWPRDFNVSSTSFLFAMKKIFGEPNGSSGDKVSFNYVFKSEVPGVYYEIRDYRGFLSCGIGFPASLALYIDKGMMHAINDGLEKLIIDCVIAYNLVSV